MKKSIRTQIIIIETTANLIYKIGLNNISIRKISKESGYNTSNIYTYFDNLNNLLIIAAFKFLEKYYFLLRTNIDKISNNYDLYLKIWDIFLDFFLEYPELFELLFLNDDNLDIQLAKYYELYPEAKISGSHNVYNKMIETSNLFKRNYALIELIQQDYQINNPERLNRLTVGYVLGITRDLRRSEEKKQIYMDDIKYLLDSNIIKKIK